MKNVEPTIPISGVPAIPRPEAPEDTRSVRLSEKDEAEVMAAVENPPAPNEAALRAARRFLQKHG